MFAAGELDKNIHVNTILYSVQHCFFTIELKNTVQEACRRFIILISHVSEDFIRNITPSTLLFNKLEQFYSIIFHFIISLYWTINDEAIKSCWLPYPHQPDIIQSVNRVILICHVLTNDLKEHIRSKEPIPPHLKCQMLLAANAI